LAVPQRPESLTFTADTALQRLLGRGWTGSPPAEAWSHSAWTPRRLSWPPPLRSRPRKRNVRIRGSHAPRLGSSDLAA